MTNDILRKLDELKEVLCQLSELAAKHHKQDVAADKSNTATKIITNPSLPDDTNSFPE